MKKFAIAIPTYNEFHYLKNNLNCKIITTEKDYFRIDNKNINQIKFLISELEDFYYEVVFLWYEKT